MLVPRTAWRIHVVSKLTFFLTCLEGIAEVPHTLAAGAGFMAAVVTGGTAADFLVADMGFSGLAAVGEKEGGA